MLRRVPSVVLVVAFAMLGAASCGKDDPVAPRDDVYLALIEEFGLVPLPDAPYPPYNGHHPDRILLGRLLFFDPILGGESAPWIKAAAGRDPYRDRSHDVACGTCHHPRFGFADGRRLGAGVGGSGEDGSALGPDRSVPARSLVTGEAVGLEPRNSMSVLNTALNGKNSPEPVSESFQFMDGRVATGLEAQALDPLFDREEMAGDAYGRAVLGSALTADAVRDSVTARIRSIAGYFPLFEAAFPGEIDTPSDITINHITKALAAYERELVAPGSRYDRFVAGEFTALDGTERLGFEVFFGKGLCGSCHGGPMLSDFSFHVQGVAEDYDAVLPGFPGKDGEGHDLGRFHADPEEFAGDKYAFRTLTIRNVEQTAPYFHAGNAATLEDVVEFYDRGGRGPGDVSDDVLAAAGAERSPFIRPSGLTASEKQALVAFLRTTTAGVRAGPAGIDLTLVPARVPSGLLPPGVPTPPGPGPFLP